jgi:XRE family transcriptional regulator, regulator of sulfur utilization
VRVRLKEWRERREYSLRGLGERAGVSYVTLSRIESGLMSPTVEMLEKLARALGIGLRDFFPADRPRRAKRR